MKSLAVVIPAYNVAPYIAECIASVTNQPGSRDALEVFVIVDGATDNTLSEAKKSTRGNEEFVHVISQENAGLSAARNTGLDLAKARFITFLDGDDIWQPDFLDSILPLLDDIAPDIIEYDALEIDEDGRDLKRLKIALAGDGAQRDMDPEGLLEYFRCYTWARVYRTKLPRGRRFPVGQRFEDVATTPWYYWHSRRIVSVGRPLIGYRQRPFSILKTPSPQDIRDLAATTTSAASMFMETRSAYWQHVAHRTFQQACRRTTWQPLTTWPANLRMLRKAVDGVPRPPGFPRWLQVNATLLYTTLIYFKRKLLD